MDAFTNKYVVRLKIDNQITWHNNSQIHLEEKIRKMGQDMKKWEDETSPIKYQNISYERYNT